MAIEHPHYAAFLDATTLPPRDDSLSHEQLARLSEAERLELLALLEQQEEQRAAMPADDRKPIVDFLFEAARDRAGASEDPEAFWRAEIAHQRAYTANLGRLHRERPLPRLCDIGSHIAALTVRFDEARRLAAADGYPAPQ